MADDPRYVGSLHHVLGNLRDPPGTPPLIQLPPHLASAPMGYMAAPPVGASGPGDIVANRPTVALAAHKPSLPVHAGVGLAAGAGLGFALGGPVGAAIGAGAGGAVGALVAKVREAL